MTYRMTARAAAVKEKPTWLCLNHDCARVFGDFARNPECPSCGCVKVTATVPQVAIQGPATKHADNTLRDVAKSFKLSNLRSARAGEQSHPGLPTPKGIPGAPPINAGYGVSVPRTLTASAQFAPMPRSMPGLLPVGAQFKKPKGNIPTQVRYETRRGDTK